MKNFAFAIIIIIYSLTACKPGNVNSRLHFTMLTPSETGVDFTNTITEDDSINMFVNEYTYMGGGVGIGDFNNDGLPDIFFAGNQVRSKLYVNKGKMQFDDVTKQAGVTTNVWCTGVSVIDINNDGWQDIYVSVSGKKPGVQRQNLLFINQHNLSFKEQAADYGLADTGYSTQAVFFDYDNDGRLDVYLLNHTLEDYRPNDIRDTTVTINAIAADKLYRNMGVPAGGNHPVFEDVSKQAGIVEDGNGLGIAVCDFNNDGYPDIYVANDYIRNDLLWLNNRNGTFTNCIASAIKHQSYSSMGTDAADINNDGQPDIITLDMQPETNERKKMMYSFLNEQRHALEINKGYQPQYIHNMLQLNNGVRQINNRTEPFFSEVGEMAGIAETDWSWSVLMADFDNDGWKDVHITNGLGRDPTNVDFLEYRHNTVMQSGIPDNNAVQRKNFMEHLASLGEVSLRNYVYLNKGGFTFEDVSAAAGIDKASISNGAAYADLDNDGDLDMVVNNINSNAFVMRNDGGGQHRNNNITIKLNGDSLNKEGIGAVIYAYTKDTMQRIEQYPVRGYLSTVDARLHLGFGQTAPDSIKVVWPGNKAQLIVNPGINKTLTLYYRDAKELNKDSSINKPLFSDITGLLKTDFKHNETFFFDYQFQPLLKQQYSQEGPFISTGDINGDGLEDFFIGGAFNQSGVCYLQNNDGSFTGKNLVTGKKYEEDMQSALFDADGDKDLDLLIVGGSSEFDEHSSFYRPRLYLNNGKGDFKLDSMAFSPLVRTAGKSLAIADMDGDGDMDVFIGGRVSLNTYPKGPQSYILRNEKGSFVDVTDQVCPALNEAGMVNAAAWTDIDGDKRPDLIIAGDWMPVRIFKNTGSMLTETTASAGLVNLPGFWRSLCVADIDNDGDLDIIAGNLGLNNPYHITLQQPAELISKDFDGNGIADPIFCYNIKGNDGNYALLPGMARDEWARQMPSIKKQFENNASYAKASMKDILPQQLLGETITLTCNEVRTGYFINDGKGQFSFKPLPAAAQVAPVNTIVYDDVTGEGIKDIILGGNDYEAGVYPGRYDASYGLVLAGNNKGNFTPLPPVKSGFIVDGDVRNLKMMTIKGRTILLCAVNNSRLQAFESKR